MAPLTPSSRAGGVSGLVVVGVGYQWVDNGCNFLAFEIGGDAFHPLLLAVLRFGIAVILILQVAARRREPTYALAKPRRHG